jgi:DNA topoisomerase-1
MTPAVYDVTTAKIAAVSAKNKKTYDFRASGSVMRFDGFLKVYEVAEVVEEKKDEDEGDSSQRLPNLDGVKRLENEKLNTKQSFTQPPPRYNEASLVKVLEERGCWTAVDVCFDHQHDSGSRVCGQAGWAAWSFLSD